MCTYSSSIRDGSRGSLGSYDPLQKYIREAKRMMYWYKTTLNCWHFSALHDKTTYIFQEVAPTMPLLHIWFKASLYLLKYALNLALGMILVLY